MTRPNRVTPGQLECLAAIARHSAEFGYPPTVRWLCGALHVSSSNAVAQKIAALVVKGCVTRVPHSARSITITPMGRRLLRVARDVVAP